MDNVRIKTLIALVATLAMLPLSAACTSEGTPEKIIVPEGFKGSVLILREYEGGAPLTEEDGWLMVELPPTGVLKTNHTYEKRQTHKREYYWRLPDKSLKQIAPSMIHHGEPEPGAINMDEDARCNRKVEKSCKCAQTFYVGERDGSTDALAEFMGKIENTVCAKPTR